MAILFNRESKSGGGMGVGVTLWSNTGSLDDFAGQDVTLNQNYTNFDYIGFRYICRNGYDDNHIYEAIVKKDLLQQSSLANYKPLATISMHASGYQYYRYIYQKSETELSISRCTRDGATFTTSLIPVEIVGY